MAPPKPATSTSTENLLLKCQKETRKKCLPPEWSIHPPNQPIRPPIDTLALAIQIDASSPSSVTFYESATDRLVGSIGSEYRGSIVVVPWRPGLKFMCQSTCRRKIGCRIGVVREAKAKMGVRAKRVSIGNATTIPVKRSINIVEEKKKSAASVGNAPSGAALEKAPAVVEKTTPVAALQKALPPVVEKAPPPATLRIPSPTSKSSHVSRIPRRVSISTDKSPSPTSTKHVSFDDKSINGKSSIETDGSRIPKLKTKIDIKPGQRL